MEIWHVFEGILRKQFNDYVDVNCEKVHRLHALSRKFDL